MNLEEKRRISQNLSSLKEHLSDLDPVIDRLIEKEVFKLEHRDQIEQAGSHPKQINEFIKILTSSPNADAYVTFLDALHSEKFYGLADKIQSTPVFQRCMSSASTSLAYSEDSRHDAGAAESAGGVANYAGVVRELLNNFGKRQEEMLYSFEKQQREERREFEKRRLEDKREMENLMRDDKVENEKVRKQDKLEHRQQLDRMWKEWQEEKTEILKKNEDMIDKLHQQINEIRQADMEYDCLQEKYDYLRDIQQRMREKDNERVERLRQKTKEKEDLRKENVALKGEINELTDRLKSLTEIKETEKWEIDCIAREKEKIEKALTEKQMENIELKKKVTEQYNKIQDILAEQKSSSKVDDPGYVRSVEQQMRKVDAVYDVMGQSHEDELIKLKRQVKLRTVNPLIPSTYKKTRKSSTSTWKC
ncbi:rRNA biogenesis protein RRP36-like [Pecten maximus]|uniref:rRNA biogenesis protein RRP36-like n=1 Tax=Pecten maximus TaxID=6579 RepID=UPI001458B39A|nr:rRNA biogenesis protein RRP36-like [Pecten maximus]